MFGGTCVRPCPIQQPQSDCIVLTSAPITGGNNAGHVVHLVTLLLGCVPLYASIPLKLYSLLATQSSNTPVFLQWYGDHDSALIQFGLSHTASPAPTPRRKMKQIAREGGVTPMGCDCRGRADCCLGVGPGGDSPVPGDWRANSCRSAQAPLCPAHRSSTEPCNKPFQSHAKSFRDKLTL